MPWLFDQSGVLIGEGIARNARGAYPELVWTYKETEQLVSRPDRAETCFLGTRHCQMDSTSIPNLRRWDLHTLWFYPCSRT